MTTVEKIHNEIDTAQDLLLAEAKQILAENPLPLLTKAERLKNLGFTNTPEVKQTEKLLEAHVKSKASAEQIEYYMRQYPFMKFVTTEKFETILEKYNLIYAPVSFYNKSIPNKNIQEIENAQKIKSEDLEGTIYKLIPTDNSFIKFMNSVGLKESITQKDYDDLLIKHYGRTAWSIQDDTGFFAVWDKTGRIGRYDKYKIEITNRNGLFIAAPSSHFNDLKGLKKQNRSFFSFVKAEPKDPIVFIHVKGGVLVLSKWGDEAEDEELVVPINN